MNWAWFLVWDTVLGIFLPCTQYKVVKIIASSVLLMTEWRQLFNCGVKGSVNWFKLISVRIRRKEGALYPFCSFLSSFNNLTGFHMIFRRRVLYDFRSQQSCEYAVDIFFPLISLLKFCAYFSQWCLWVELQGAASSCAEVRYAAGSTYSSSHSGNMPSLIWEILSASTKKCFSLHPSCALTVSWPEDLTCIQLHKLYIAQKGRGVHSRA